MNRAKVCAAARRYLVYYAVYLLFAKPFLVTLLGLPGPWGPTLAATLPTGEQVELWCRRWGRESDELLYVSDHRGRVEYIINNIHALDLWYARIRVNKANTHARVESRSAVVATLDL